MNLREASNWIDGIAFRVWRALLGAIPGGRIAAFGAGDRKIGLILVVNLDRQPTRLRRTLRELGRFRSSDGISLKSLVQRMAAVDARDGRNVAASADVDQTYRIGDQLYVQPDVQLEQCFGKDEAIRMTREEVAVARSHIEAWKSISVGAHSHVLVLEDDIWFKWGAVAAIENGWSAAVERSSDKNGPNLVYFSYVDAGGSASRAEVCDALFRPKRGLWHLSGYVLSRNGAMTLLRSMPVVGPVDMWINYRFEELGALALSSPAILQRPDGVSDNSYSVLPYLARAGVIDASASQVPGRVAAGPILAWTAHGDREGIAMALSMLGLRVRAFDGTEADLDAADLELQSKIFDALVDAPLSDDALIGAIKNSSVRFVVEEGADGLLEPMEFPMERTVVLRRKGSHDELWGPLCAVLGLASPVQAFPMGTPRSWRMFRDDGAIPLSGLNKGPGFEAMDDTAWSLGAIREPSRIAQLDSEAHQKSYARRLHVPLTVATAEFAELTETFPGNLAAFGREGLEYGAYGVRISCTKVNAGSRAYRSGSLGSTAFFGHGRFEAEIRAASGSGLVTGFFLHRDSPRQEIDIEFLGNRPNRMLVNVFFNPGDEGATFAFGYRGSPLDIDLGFDATKDFHHYAIEWQPGFIAWLVDGRVVHRRASWDPTPIPHLPMRLHANLWISRSEDLAGCIDEEILPASAALRNVAVWS